MTTEIEKNNKKLFDAYLTILKNDPDHEESKNFIINMILDGKISCKAIDKDTAGFKEYNMGDGKCSRCGCKTHKGQPIFFQHKKPWCVNCATDDEKQLPFYIRWLNKQGPQNTNSFGEISLVKKVKFTPESDDEDMELKL